MLASGLLRRFELLAEFVQLVGGKLTSGFRQHFGLFLPAVVLHTSGNLYSNIDLWLHGQAEWQAASGPAALVWTTGPDASFWMSSLALIAVAAADVWVYFKLAGAARRPR